MNGFTHFDHEGNAIMVDVHEKADTYRVAIAQGTITVNKEVFDAITHHTAKKGDVLGVARIAGIMAAKKNAELIPLCHIIALTDCEVQFSLDVANHQITAICRTSCVGKTGVEMEAMTGVSVALLTIYDMCKAMDRSMVISGIQLLEKLGGKSGHYKKSNLYFKKAPVRTIFIVLSGQGFCIYLCNLSVTHSYAVSSSRTAPISAGLRFMVASVPMPSLPIFSTTA